ncbi:MAG: hypothetical protein DMF49_08320 [Acidobacteria bacterium]|nr:MAG: hypothetical protein DMF49_08320 [Acidobacteriota bacterium]
MPGGPEGTLTHYRLLEKIGKGGMGVVYKALDTTLNRHVAIKILPSNLIADPERRLRLLREARTAAAVNHPNIATIHQVDEEDGVTFLVMELVEGKTLRELAGQALSLESIASMGEQIARALAVAHAAGIIHRDIKPGNIMVRADGYVKVLDFGIARILPLGPRTSDEETVSGSPDGILLGTIHYMSPEQGRAELVTSASDIFSLGIVLYELATGRHPFTSESRIGVLHAIVSQEAVSPSKVNPEVSATLEALILQMLEKDPQMRPGAREVEVVLGALSGKSARAATIIPAPAAKGHTVGREKERAELRAAYESTSAGRGLVLCVAGEPGLGKTTLVEGFLDDLRFGDASCCIARGRCSERLSGAEAYLPLLEALESLFRSETGDSIARMMKLVAPNWYAQVTPSSGEHSSPSRLTAQTVAVSEERLKRELVAFSYSRIATRIFCSPSIPSCKSSSTCRRAASATRCGSDSSVVKRSAGISAWSFQRILSRQSLRPSSTPARRGIHSSSQISCAISGIGELSPSNKGAG